MESNDVSKVHAYAEHCFVVLHATHLGESGYVHYVELDQFIGRNYQVTGHGPLNIAVHPEVAALDTSDVLRRLESGRLQPAPPTSSPTRSCPR